MSVENAVAKLEYIAGTKTSIKDAIEAKGVTVGDAAFREYADKIGAIETGGSTGDHKVRFIDWNGTVLKTEYVADGESATAPILPAHDLLTFKKWNNVFTNITKSKDIGALYDVADGKTYLFLSITKITGDQPAILLSKADTSLMTITWGDGTSQTTSGGGIQTITKTDAYATVGDYVVTIECTGDYFFHTYIFNNNSYYNSCLTKAFIGDNVTSIGDDVFRYCHSLRSIVIPDGLTTFGNTIFHSCYSLISVVLPDGLTSFGNNTFMYCYVLTSIAIPDEVTSIGFNAFSGCHALNSIVIPDGVTIIGIEAFNSCYSLNSVIIPDGVASIEFKTFVHCYSLKSVVIPDGVKKISTYAFTGCYALSSIMIPGGVTSIEDSAFSHCYVIASIVIPDGVTSISYNTFVNCFSLNSVIIPQGVTSIASNAFAYCKSIISYEIHASIPPTLGNISAFNQINKITKIYVPDANVDDYKTATNWLTYADYIYPLSEKP